VRGGRSQPVARRLVSQRGALHPLVLTSIVLGLVLAGAWYASPEKAINSISSEGAVVSVSPEGAVEVSRGREPPETHGAISRSPEGATEGPAEHSSPAERSFVFPTTEAMGHGDDARERIPADGVREGNLVPAADGARDGNLVPASHGTGGRDAHPTASFVLRAKSVYPVTPDQPGPIRRGVIIVRNGRIESVGANLEIPRDLPLIDLRDAVVCPGFVSAASAFGGQHAGAESISAGYHAVDAFDPYADYRLPLSHGTTTAHISPGEHRLVSGVGGVVKLGASAES
jgi:hypothetical protein